MSVDLEKHRPLARLLVRLMGFFFAIQGGSGVISSRLDAFWQIRASPGAPLTYAAGQPVAWTIGSLFMLLAGFYLVFKGTAAMDAVFHESLAAPGVACPHCGYDLRATLRSQACPECGGNLAPTGAKPEP